MTIIEIAYTFHMNSIYNDNQNYFFLYVMNNEIVKDHYIANWSSSYDNICPESYTKVKFLNLNYLNNLNVTEITNDTYRVDWADDPTGNTIFNNTYMNWKFYEFDLFQKGDKNVSLLYNYSFQSMGGKTLCFLHVYEDGNYEAFRVISYNKSCKDTYNKFHTADCGTYLNNSYRMCIILEHLQYTNKTKLSDNPIMTDDFYCPINQFYIIYFKNPNWTPESKTESLYTMRPIIAQRNLSPDDPNLIDKSFYMNLAPFVNIGTPYSLENPKDVMVYNEDPELIHTYMIGEKYGIITPLHTQIFTDEFFFFYNDTFFVNETTYTDKNGAKQTTYGANFMSNWDMTEFFRPAYNKDLKMTINAVSFPIVSQSCYQNIFEKNNIDNILTFFHNLRIIFFSETISLVSAWLFAKLFVCLWCYGKIRFMILLEKSKLKMTQPDITSETVTKYTFKAISGVIFLIIITALNINQNGFNTILDWTDDILRFDCFGDKIEPIISEYSEFIKKLASENDMVLTAIYTSLTVEVLTIAIYLIYDKIDNTPILSENTKELNHLKFD